MNHEKVKKQIEEVLSRIPADIGLTDDEVRLEVAAKIVEEFPKGLNDDTDIDLQKAVKLIQEAGVYLGNTLHKEDEKGKKMRIPDLWQQYEDGAVTFVEFLNYALTCVDDEDRRQYKDIYKVDCPY